MEYTPECLTISLSDICNLDCKYCYSKTISGKRKYNVAKNSYLNENIFLKSINAAFDLILDNILPTDKRFVFGFQGEGEPFMEYKLLRRSTELLNELCNEYKVSKFSFITTNGTLQQDYYEWAAENFDRLCFSIDGDQAIHNYVRYFKNKTGTLDAIVGNLEYLIKDKQSDKYFCRTTITSLNVNDQNGIIEFLIGKLGFKEVIFEPFYNFGYDSDLYPDPNLFVDQFIHAAITAEKLGGKLIYTGFMDSNSCLPYCNIHKNVLNINRMGSATACMFRLHENKESYFNIGQYDEKSNIFTLDKIKIEGWKRATLKTPIKCQSCKILFKCSLGCPDVCLIEKNIENKNNNGISNSLRCKINLLLNSADFY